MKRRALRSLALVALAASIVLGAGPVGAAPAETSLEVNAPSAILMDALSGQVIYEKAADDRHAPASITKLMTLLLAVEAVEAGTMSLKDIVVGTAHAESYGGTQIWLKDGEEMDLETILLSIAVGSANDASVALAEHMCGTEEEFAARMNERAAELGMTSTNFTNSHGLDDPDHYTTARDIARLCREVVRHPKILELTRIYEVHIRDGETWLVNRNRMINYYQGCDGLKTGWTDQAGYSVAVTAKRGETRFIAVIMGATSPGDRFADTTKMLNYAFARYTSLEVAERGASFGSVPVNLGQAVSVEAVAPDDYGALLEKGTEGQIQREIVLEPLVEAPLRRGDPVGAIILRQGEQEIGRWALVADRDVEPISFAGLVWRLFLRVLGGQPGSG